MTIQEIKTAVDNGITVHWFSSGYKVIKDNKNQYLITYMPSGFCWGLTNLDGTRLNGKPTDFYTIPTNNDVK